MGQALIKGEMLDYYDISGCYILKPASYGIWQEIQSESHALYPVSCV
jgi:prolyl-tRNA synthetase